MSLMSAKQRHELKYEISPHDAFVLSQRLGMLFPRDGHAGPDGRYVVRSLYFDTPFDDALREKSEGFTARAKWRLRTYGTAKIEEHEPGRTVRLEKKVKRDGAGSKHAAWITPSDALRLCGRNAPAAQGPATGADRSAPPGVSGGDENPVLAEFRQAKVVHGLRPCVVVAYEREAFLCAPGNVRVTIDSRLRSSPHPASFFDPARLFTPYAPDTVVLEVKFDDFLPDVVRDAVRVPSAVRTAHSKYALGRRFE